jgi:MFS family permease
MSARDTFSSLRHRNFRLFFAGQGISQVGNWLTLIAQTLLVLELTDSGVAVGLLQAFQFGPVLLLGAWAGLVADRSDKRKLLIAVQVFAMVQSFALGALAFQDHPPVWTVYLIASLGGVATAFDNPARRSFVVEMVPEDDVNNAVSMNSALMTSSRIFGPALAGLLVGTIGFGWTFWADAASYVAVIYGLYRMDPTALRQPPAQARGKGQVREGLRYAWRVPELRIPLLMMAVVGTFSFNFATVLPLFTTRDLAGSELTFSLLMSIVSVGSLTGALVAARRKRIDVRLVAVTSVAFGATMLLLGVSPNLASAFPFGVAMGFASISFMTASTAIVQIVAAPSMRGRVLALQAIVFLGSTPIGGPIVGYISEHLGARYGLFLGAAAALGAGAVGLVVVRQAGAPSHPDATAVEVPATVT